MTNVRYCKYCGLLILNDNRLVYCCYACMLHIDKYEYGKNLTYRLALKCKSIDAKKKLKEKQKRKHEKVLDRIMLILAKRKAMNDGLLGFNSVVGIDPNLGKSKCLLNLDEAKELGLLQVFDGSEFYWNPKNKALYIKHKNMYLALTSEL